MKQPKGRLNGISVVSEERNVKSSWAFVLLLFLVRRVLTKKEANMESQFFAFILLSGQFSQSACWYRPGMGCCL